MRIGIDIDGVLTDMESFIFDYMSKYLVLNAVAYNIEKSCYRFSDTFNVDEIHSEGFLKDYFDTYITKEEARKFASEVIEKLKSEGNEIYIITARTHTNRNDTYGKKMRKLVKKWLKKNNIVYDKLIFSKGESERKDYEINEYKIDLMIEDNPNNIKELSEIIPVICYDAGYNKECFGSNVYRCYSWYDIYKKINEIRGNDEI